MRPIPQGPATRTGEKRVSLSQSVLFVSTRRRAVINAGALLSWPTGTLILVYFQPSAADLVVGLIVLLGFSVFAFNRAAATAAQERMRADYAAAVRRARDEHREGCILASAQRERALADMLDAAVTLSDNEAQLLDLLLERRSATSSPPLRLVSPQTQHANGHTRN